jgi:hypothetical protein
MSIAEDSNNGKQPIIMIGMIGMIATADKIHRYVDEPTAFKLGDLRKPMDSL